MARCWFTGGNPLWPCLERIERGAVPSPSREGAGRARNWRAHRVIFGWRCCFLSSCRGPASLLFALWALFLTKLLPSPECSRADAYVATMPLWLRPHQCKGTRRCVSHLSCCCLPCFFPRGPGTTSGRCTARAWASHRSSGMLRLG